MLHLLGYSADRGGESKSIQQRTKRNKVRSYGTWNVTAYILIGRLESMLIIVIVDTFIQLQNSVLRVLVGAVVVEGELTTEVAVVDIIVENVVGTDGALFDVLVENVLTSDVVLLDVVVKEVLGTDVVLVGMAVPEPEFVEETTPEPDAPHQLPTLKTLLSVQVDSSPF